VTFANSHAAPAQMSQKTFLLQTDEASHRTLLPVS